MAIESTTTTPLEGKRRREELIRVGRDLFVDRPYDAVSVDDIAARMGISKGLLYHYFPSKRDLYAAVVRSAADEMRTLVAPESGSPGPARLRRSLDAYLDFVEHHEQGYRTVLRAGVGADKEIWQVGEEMRAQTVEWVLQGVQVEHPRPVLRSALRGWVGLLEAMSMDWLEHRDLSRKQLVGALMLALGSALAMAQRIDPEVEFELPPGASLQIT